MTPPPITPTLGARAAAAEIVQQLRRVYPDARICADWQSYLAALIDTHMLHEYGAATLAALRQARARAEASQ